jgi:hypothetical protein
MKFILFGLTILEIKHDHPAISEPPTKEASHARAATAHPTRTARALSDLHAPADILPRTLRGTIDADAALQMFGLSDGALLWQHRFKNGTAGAALKRMLGSQGRMPTFPPLDSTKPDLRTFPAKNLPCLPSTDRLDVAASLALFKIKDPAVLWAQRFRPDSAGGYLKMRLGQKRTLQPPPGGAEAPSNQPELAPNWNQTPPPGARSECAPCLKYDGRGQIDIPASLSALGISDPKSLWTGVVQAGSPAHALKKEIARALVGGEAVPGITRSDVGLC